MPPRYAYWTILIDGKATAFRAQDRDELLPTFNQLARKNPDAVMKYFSHGKLWDTPEQARWARTNARPPLEKRGPDWRPGGTHKDPRARFDKRKRQDRAPGRPPGDRTAKPFDRPPAPSSHRPPDRRFEKPSGDRRFEKKPSPDRRFEKPSTDRRFDKPAPRSFERPSGQPSDRPPSKKPFDRPWRKPSDRPWKKPSDRPTGSRPDSARRTFDKPGGSREGSGSGGSGSGARPFGKPPRPPSRPRGDFKKRR